jgi:lipoprotein-anchoring transpeptidase ErfK/SrfK
VAVLVVGALVAIVIAVRAVSPARPVLSSQPASPSASTPASTSLPPPSTLTGFKFYAATVRVPNIVVRQLPDSSAPIRVVLADHNENGVTQTLLIKGEQPGPAGVSWYRVLLPIRPNGSTGWVRSSDVEVTGIDYQLVIHLAAFRLDIFDAGQLQRTMAIGEGTDQTPTPGGEYYIKELLRPPNPDTVYGDYVFGLSGFSNVLTSWPQGGVLGVHGTNDPTDSIGRKISHGCIRLSNQDIDRLANLLPLGTPVEVEP